MPPDITFKSIDGNTHQLSDFKGRYVIVWFMAVWCPSCGVLGTIIGDALENKDVAVTVIVLWTELVLKKAGIYGP